MEKELCPVCPHSREIDNPLLTKLLRYRSMIDGGCPVGRHELTNDEWILLAVVRAESDRIAVRDPKQNKG